MMNDNYYGPTDGSDQTPELRIFAFLQNYVQVPGFNPYRARGVWFKNGDEWEWFVDAEALGHAVVKQLEFRGLQLERFLETPDGELIARGVSLFVPKQFSVEYDLVTNGLRYAADLQRQGKQKFGEQVAGGILVGCALLLLGALIVGLGRRGS